MNAVMPLAPTRDFGFLRMEDVPLAGRRVLARVDFNVPIQDGDVVCDRRIRASVPTVRSVLDAGAGVTLVSHLGRPEAGRDTPGFSLEPVARRLAHLLGEPVRLAPLAEAQRSSPGEVVLLENIRFSRGEKDNDPALARRLASLCEVFVMDAFGCAHRRHASTCGVIEAAGIACAGPLLCAEIESVLHAVNNFRAPLVAIVGGSKISTKFGMLESLCRKVDCLVPGGGIANTLLAAAGHGVGASLYEPDAIDSALRLQESLRAREARLLLPDDVVCARSPDSRDASVRRVGEVSGEEMILDIGPSTRRRIEKTVMEAGTILWNGPVGVFERTPFAQGTRALAEAIAGSRAYSLVGGGETLAAVAQFGIEDAVSHISTGGGALLELVEKGDLPVIAALRNRALGR